MELDHYRILISNLPVRLQSFTTKRTTWQKAEKQIEWLEKLNDNLFKGNKTLVISRQDIFETTNLRELIIKTVYWGYIGGMRGNHFVNILTHIDIIEQELLFLKQKSNPTTTDFSKLTKTFKNVEGLGLSTYSKLLYFFKISINENPCLILDQKLIDVFASKSYDNFQQLRNIRYNNAEKKYLDFLQLMNIVSKNFGTEVENIEQFLFIFGKNLKSINK